VRFSDLAAYFEQLEATSSGNEQTAILARLIAESPAEEIDIISYFTLGKIAPDYSGLFLGMGESLIRSAIALTADVEEDTVARMREVGDLGDVAFLVRVAEERNYDHLFQVESPLSVEDVHRGLTAIAGTTGTGSQETKKGILAALISHATPRERRYIVRLAAGEMRLGAGEMTILDALATAFLGSKKKRVPLEHAYNISSDIGYLAKVLKTEGLSGVMGIEVSLHRPIRPMLAQRVSRFEEIMEKIHSPVVAAEEKYDGERIQAHKDGDRVELFSRRLTNVTAQYPDVVEEVRQKITADSAILDGEAVAYDVVKGRYYSFQNLMQRRRKYRVSEYAKRFPARYVVFDLLYLNGEPYLSKGYPARRRMLTEIVTEGKYIVLPRRVTSSHLEEINAFFIACIKKGLEGIIAKSCADDSHYQAGSRDWQWIKWKESYGSEIHDTLDLVVVGANAGRGKRAGTYGSVLCAAYNPKLDLFQTVCGMGTGFSDEELHTLPEKFQDLRTEKRPARLMVTRQTEPDYYFIPKIVLEVLGSEITESRVHTCAWNEARQTGLSLRFPRFVRWRPDKSIEEATTAEEVMRIFKEQGHGGWNEGGIGDQEP
jgi:DNA ligase 1